MAADPGNLRQAGPDRGRIALAGGTGPEIELDPLSALDLGSVRAGGVDWAPGLAIVDDGDPRIYRALQGFLFTAGPDHIRHPEPVGEGRGVYPLHGSLASHPAREIMRAADGTSCRAVIPIRLADGADALLHRCWSIDASGTVHLHDRLENSSSRPFAPMMLYHVNVGGALLGPETRLEGEMLENGGFAWDFRDDPGGVFCVPAGISASHEASLCLGPVAAAQGLSLRLTFALSNLPYLQLWRCRREGVNVLGLEPCSHALQKRAALEAAGALETLQPGQVREFWLRFAFS